MGQKKPPRLGSTICTDKGWPEKATQTRQYDLLRPNMGQKKPPRLGSTICTDKSWPEKATKTRQYDLLRPNMSQKKPPRLGSTICYGQELSRKSHQDSAVRCVTAKSWPEKATKTRQYDLLWLSCQKKPPRLVNTICYGQTWARKSHQDSAVRFVTAKKWPEKATKTWQYLIVAKNLAKPPRLGSTICYGQELARKSHQDSAVRFVTAKSWPERATETQQYDLLRPNVGQKEPPRLGSTICYGQTLARKSHQDSAVRFVTARTWPETVTETRQYDLLPPRFRRKKPSRLGNTICYGQTWARKSHQDSAVRFVTAKSCGQKEPPRLGSTICYGHELARKSHRTTSYGQELARKSHHDSAVRFVTAKRGSEKATKTRQYDLLRPRVGQKKPPKLGSTICYGQTWARKSHRDSEARFVAAKRGPETTTKTRQYDLLRPRVGQKKPPRLGSTICYGQDLSRKSRHDSAVRFVTAKSWPEKATKTQQYDLFRPRVGQQGPLRFGSTICYGQTWARKSHRDSVIRFVTAKCGPEKASRLGSTISKRGRVGQKEPPRLGSTICYGQTWARKSHQDSVLRFVTAKSWPEKATETRQYDFVMAARWPERATKTRQYDLLRPRVGQKKPPRLGSTICYGQTCARKSHQDSAIRFVTAKRGPERATKTVRFVTAKSWQERATKTRQ